MKLRFAAGLLLSSVPITASFAQANPYWPGAQSGANVWNSGGHVSCTNPASAGPTPSDPATSSGTCKFNGLMQTNGAAGSSTSIQTGDLTSTGSALSNPGGSRSASASLSGTLATGGQAQSWAQGWGYQFLTISDPSSVYKIVMSATGTLNRAGAGSLAEYGLYGYTVNPLYGYVQNFAGGAYTYDNGLPGTYSCNASVCSSTAPTLDLSVELGGNVLNSNGVFAAYTFAYASVATSSNPVNGSASADLSGIQLTIYGKDAAGNVYDATDLHTVTFDPNATVVTPEPASLILMATGAAVVFGVTRRRRPNVA
jgi:hypothetical protein